MDWKRPKTIKSKTEHIETNCGTVHYTFGYDDDRLIEVKGVIGKGGTCCNVMLDTICKLMSICLQSQMPRYKIVKKFKKQFEDMRCGQEKFYHEKEEYWGCVDYPAKKVIKELNE